MPDFYLSVVAGIQPKVDVAQRSQRIVAGKSRERNYEHASGCCLLSRIADIFRANVLDSSPTSYTIEVTGDVRKVQAIINLLQPLGIKELVRTGRIAIGREPTRSTQTQSRPLAKAN